MIHLTKKFFQSGLFLKFQALLIGLIVFRILAAVPLPTIDGDVVRVLLQESGSLLRVLDIFSGGGFSNVSIVMLGVIPYITVSIIVQLLTVMSPKIHSLYHEEGEIGRRRLGQYTRIATVPVAFLNAVSILLLLQAQGFVDTLSTFEFISSVIFIVSGTIILMWVGELISEFGIGNGISFIIFSSIALNVPPLLTQLTFALDPIVLLTTFGYIVGVFLVLLFGVWINEGERPVPITHSRFGQEQMMTESYLPIKINPAGVLPIIFSLTILTALLLGSQYAATLDASLIQNISEQMSIWLQNPYIYSALAFVATVFFVYFHSPIVFNVERLADSIGRQGAYIPGIRPGEETKKYVSDVLMRVIFYTAIFLSLITVLPTLITGNVFSTFGVAVGGTGIIIAISVVLDIYKKSAVRMLE